jgi:lysophospholipase L1-like esterase
MSTSRSDRPTPLTRLVAAGAAALVVVLGLAACGGDAASDDGAGTDDGEHKVTVGGDSISVGLGTQLREVVADADGAEGVVVKVIGESGTGLARPDRFDWPTRVRQLAADFPPDVFVFSVGSNDAQDLTDADGEVVVTMSEHEAWDEEYSRRLAEVFDAFRPADGEDPSTKVVWVGHVRTEDDAVADTNRRVHRLAAEVAADRPWVEVRDLTELLGVGEQTATRCLVADGLHLNGDCLTEAGQALLPDLVPS